MLKESLPEYLEAAKFCCYYRKNDPKWDSFQGDGCLGYPGGVLLFSIVDSIGSYFAKDKSLEILVDGKKTHIISDGWEHFKILNSKYFGQNLSSKFLKALYAKFRSQLTHNSVLGKHAYLFPDTQFGDQVFLETLLNEHPTYIISMRPFYELCANAVKIFVNDIDNVVPNSNRGKSFH